MEVRMEVKSSNVHDNLNRQLKQAHDHKIGEVVNAEVIEKNEEYLVDENYDIYPKKCLYYLVIAELVDGNDLCFVKQALAVNQYPNHY